MSWLFNYETGEFEHSKMARCPCWLIDVFSEDKIEHIKERYWFDNGEFNLYAENWDKRGIIIRVGGDVLTQNNGKLKIETVGD